MRLLSVLALCLVLLGCKHITPANSGTHAQNAVGKVEQATLDAEAVNAQIYNLGDKTIKELSKAMTHHHGQGMMAAADTRTQIDFMADTFGALYAKYYSFVAARIGWKNWRDFWWLVGIWGVLGVLGVVTGLTGMLSLSKGIMQFLPGANAFVWIRNWFSKGKS